MAELIFYRQKRVDGGVRTGVEFDQQTLAEQFEEGESERDPTLRWYVDLRCTGPGLPGSEAAMPWLIDHGPMIRRGMERYAGEIVAGADPDEYPLIWDFPDAPEGVDMKLACSAIRRVDAREIAFVLNELSGDWDRLIAALETAQFIHE